MSGTIVQLDGRAKAYRPLPDADRIASVHAGFACYEAGAWFDAHEAWEPAWMGTDDVTERALLQGLIKVAAAAVHGDRGNPRGVATNLAGALQRLEAAEAADRTSLPGARIDLDALVREVRDRLAIAREGRETGPVPITWWRA